MGRPSKLNDDRRDRIIRAVRAGNYREAAARAAGIAPSTLYAWLERGAAEETGPYYEFSEALQRAEAEAEVFAVATIRKAMPDDWRAAVTYLERRYPSRWRKNSSTELTGKNGGPIQTHSQHRIDMSSLSDEELELLEQIHARHPRTDRD